MKIALCWYVIVTPTATIEIHISTFPIAAMEKTNKFCFQTEFYLEKLFPIKI